MSPSPGSGIDLAPEKARVLARRTLLKRAAALAGGAAIGVLLDACGGSSSPTTAPAPTVAPTTAAGAATATRPAGSAATGTSAAGTATSATAVATTAGASASTVAGTRATGSSTAGVSGTTTASGSPGSGTAAAVPSTGQETTAKIVVAANAFLATLASGQKSSVQFDWSNTAQKQRWSNLPQGLYQRAGLMWGNLSEAQRNAWLPVMQATLSTEGYNRVMAEWSADDALAAAQGSGGGGGPGGGLMFGKQYYWVALIGAPSATNPWQWQWGGHHVTVNATIVGPNISLTPSFIGVQPAHYTDANGQTIRPLGDIEDEAFALVGSLDATQQKAAVLGSSPIDLVLGPGQDGKTIQPEGLPASQMNATQQAAFLKLIGHYTGLGYNGAARTAEIQSGLAQTYFAWYGPTTKGSAAYFRATGPTVVIEYAPQGGGGTGTGLGGAVSTDHIHGIYRDPTNDYGAKYTK